MNLVVSPVLDMFTDHQRMREADWPQSEMFPCDLCLVTGSSGHSQSSLHNSRVEVRMEGITNAGCGRSGWLLVLAENQF